MRDCFNTLVQKSIFFLQCIYHSVSRSTSVLKRENSLSFILHCESQNICIAYFADGRFVLFVYFLYFFFTILCIIYHYYLNFLHSLSINYITLHSYLFFLSFFIHFTFLLTYMRVLKRRHFDKQKKVDASLTKECRDAWLLFIFNFTSLRFRSRNYCSKSILLDNVYVEIQ